MSHVGELLFFSFHTTTICSQYRAGSAAHGQVAGQPGILLPEAVSLVVEQRAWVLHPIGGRRGLGHVSLRRLHFGPLVVFSLFDFLFLLQLGRNGLGLVGGLWWWQGVRGEIVGARFPFGLLLAAGDEEVGRHVLGIGACGTSAFTNYESCQRFQ